MHVDHVTDVGHRESSERTFPWCEVRQDDPGIKQCAPSAPTVPERASSSNNEAGADISTEEASLPWARQTF